MAVFELEAVLSLSKKAFDEGLKSSGTEMKSFGQKLTKALGTTAKITAAAVGAAATAVGAIVKQSIEAYGEFEQLVDGSQLMYGDAFDFVMERARDAYKNVQMSQSDYLRQANGLATALKNSMGGNSQAAAELADRVITAQADIVAATGVSQEAVQNAFNGITRGNYTMLDNLQLGIAGTRQGLESVITQVNAWNRANGKATRYSIKNTSDIMNALVDYVEMQGLAGYASMEAADTIQGSLSQMKASWKDLLVGLSDPDADLQQLMTNFIDSAQQAGERILPVVQTAIEGITQMVTESADTLVPMIADFVSQNAGSLISAGAKLLVALLVGLIQALPEIIREIPTIITEIYNAFVENKDSLKEAGAELLAMVATGLENALGTVIGLGAKVVENIREGIESGWDGLVSWFQGIFNDLFGGLSAHIDLSAGFGGPMEGGWIPGQAIGLDYVPRNDYAARLHRGEAVLTRAEAETWRRGQSGGRNVTINQYMQEVVRTPVEHAAATLSYFEQARWAM